SIANAACSSGASIQKILQRRLRSLHPNGRLSRPAISSMSIQATRRLLPGNARSMSLGEMDMEHNDTADPRDPNFISAVNAELRADLSADYDALARTLQRRGIDIDSITRAVSNFGVAIPSWGVGTGGTRFARFPGLGEPRNVFEKFEDCAVINALSGATPTVSLHLPWDKTGD